MSLKVKVKFTKIGNKIRYQLPFKVYCKYAQDFGRDSEIFPITDSLFGVWLGKNRKRLFKNRRVIIKKICLNQIFDACETSHMPKIKSIT